MATLSIRIPDHLQAKLAVLADQQGVSMNNLITSCLSGAVAQQTTQAFLTQRLKNVDPEKATAAFEKIVSKSRPGRGRSMQDVNAAIGRD